MSFTFKHPKYYTELRKRNKSDQAISYDDSTESQGVRPDPGLTETQASGDSTANSTRGRVAEPEATSAKPQAPSSDKKE